MTQQRIVLTGAGGFVGGHLIKLASQDPTVDIISLSSQDGTPIDICDKQAVDQAIAKLKPDALIHLAAIASPREAAADQEKAWQVNVMGTFNLASALMRLAPAARFVFAGSSEAYGESFAGTTAPLTEHALLQPLTPYGATKASADIMLGQMARQGLAATRFRPFNHAGPGQVPAYVISSFARQITRIERGVQEPVMIVGNLDVRRDFLDVRDVVSAYLKAACASDDAAIGAFNISTAKPVPIREILEILLPQTDQKIEVRVDPSLIRANEIEIVSGCAANTRNVFGWSADIPLVDTLKDTLNHWRMLADQEPAALFD